MSPFTNLNSSELQAKLAESSDLVLLDVRTPREYAAHHIPGARLVPLNTLAAAYASEVSKDDQIVCICEHGVRSVAAAGFLVSQGYENVYNLTGGMAGWDGEEEVLEVTK